METTCKRQYTTTAFALRPHGVFVTLLESLRRCYDDREAVQRRSFQNAEERHLFCACSKQTPSLGIMSASLRSHGDTTMIPRRLLRSYCAHVGVLLGGREKTKNIYIILYSSNFFSMEHIVGESHLGLTVN